MTKHICPQFCYDCNANAPLAELEWEQTPGIIRDNERRLSRGRMVGGTDHGYSGEGRDSLTEADDA